MWPTNDAILLIVLVYTVLAITIFTLLALRKRKSHRASSAKKAEAPATPANNLYLVNRRYELMTPPHKQGGMATIWLALDRKTGKPCIIKTPRRGTTLDNVYLDKLMLEARFLKKLKHPGVVKYLDDFYYRDEFHLVIEYLHGETLLAASPRSPFTEQQVIGWASQLLDALSYIHTTGIIHRDVNPKNIMVNSDGMVKLIDFGTAKDMHNPDKDKKSHDPFTQITNKGFDIPELFLGGDIDQRCDLCGLAQTCIYLLTLKQPNEICLNLFKSNWPRSYTEARALVGYLTSLGISERTAKCMAQGTLFSPSNRFADARAFQAALLSDVYPAKHIEAKPQK